MIFLFSYRASTLNNSVLPFDRNQRKFEDTVHQHLLSVCISYYFPSFKAYNQGSKLVSDWFRSDGISYIIEKNQK